MANIQGIVPNPTEVLSKSLKTITGGGIVKDELTGVDEIYKVTPDPRTGRVLPGGKVKTTGEMAARSVEEQTTVLSEDEFKQGVLSGAIPAVRGTTIQALKDAYEIVGADNAPASMKEKQSQLISDVYQMYAQGVETTVPVEFGKETRPGQYDFAPTEEARTFIGPPEKNQDLLSVQERIFEGKKAIAQVVNGAFTQHEAQTGVPIDKRDQAILERVFVKNISTGNFWDLLVEKLYENAVVGTAIYLPDVVVNYGFDAAVTAARTGTSNVTNFLKGSDDKGLEFKEEWAKGTQSREQASAWWKGVMKDTFGIKQLSTVMNEMVVNDLRNQLASGDIDQETYDRLTAKQTVTLPGGTEILTDPNYISEDLAQIILNESLDQLSNLENYGLVLAEATLTMVGAGKLKQSTGAADINSVKNRLKQLEAKSKADDAETFDIEEYAKYKGMTLIQAGKAMQENNLLKNFNEKSVNYALGVERAGIKIKELNEERDRVSIELANLRRQGRKNSSEYKTLEEERRRLNGMLIRTGFTGRFMPNVKENFKAAAPLSVFMYYAGENEGLRNFFDGDRLAAEGIGALLYLGIGRPTALMLGKGAYWTNQQAGDIVGAVSKKIEDVTTELVPYVNIRGFLRDGNLDAVARQYKSRTGNDMTPELRANVEFVGRMANALEDDSLEAVVSGMEKKLARQNRLVQAFAPEERPAIQKLLAEEFALTSSIGWLQSARQLSGFTVDARDAGTLKQLEESIQQQRVIINLNGRTGQLVRKLQEITADGTNVLDPAEVTKFERVLQESLDASIRQANIDSARLREQIIDFKQAVIKNPEVPIPSGFLERLDKSEIALIDPLDENIDILKTLQEQYTRNTELLADRADSIALFRVDDVSHIKQTIRNLEMSIHNRLRNMKNKARRGFIPLDKKATQAGKSVDITNMVTDLMSYAPEEGGLAAFFSKDSRFFRGALGKQVFTAANAIAERSLQSMEGVKYDKLFKLHSNPANQKTGFFISENPSALDILMFYTNPKNQEKHGVSPPPLLSTPGEVMDVFAAFRDYAVRTGDDALASRYEDYTGTVQRVIKDQMGEEFYNEWEAARGIYQAEWFDKLRMNGPLTRIHKSQDGPIKAVEKGQGKPLERLDMDDEIDSGNRIQFDDVGVGEELPAEVLPDRLLTHAYKTDNPSNMFDRTITSMRKVMSDDSDEAYTALLVERDKIVQEFSDILLEQGKEFVFDKTTREGLADFRLLEGTLTEKIYAKWGKDVIKQLKDRPVSVSVAAEKAGGYDFTFVEQLNKLQKAFTVSAKVNTKDGGTKIVKVKLVDLARMVEEENSISNIIGRAIKQGGTASTNDMEVLDAYKKYSTKTLNSLNTIQDVATRNVGIRDEGVLLISKFIGETNPQGFFEKFVVNGDPDAFDSLVNAVLTKAGDTITTKEGLQIDTEEALNRGIKYLMINGAMQYGGYAPVAGSKGMGMNGKEYTNHAMFNPEMLTAALERNSVMSILQGYLGEDAVNYIKDMTEILIEENEFLTRAKGLQQDINPKITNVTRPFGPNSLIARGFNLARGMVSPQYVAAEIAVNLALQSGLNLMSLAAGNREAGDIMLRLMKFPTKMTKQDLDTFGNLVTDFVLTELGGMGEAGVEKLKQALELPPEEEE